jgi:hypothetical protein
VSLDTDWFYRRPLRRAVGGLVTAVGAAGEAARGAGPRVEAALARAAQIGDPGESPNRDVYRGPVGSTLLWVLAAMALMAIYGWSILG